MSRLLGLPHHDGSPLYVADPAPSLGDLVRVRVHVPHTDGSPGADAVTVRAVHDGEPVLTPAEVEGEDAAGTWWAGAVRVVNPVTRYRFLLTGPPGSPVGAYSWLTAEGLRARDVTDAGDFRLVAHPPVPDWVADAVVYQVFPDRFARSAAAPPGPPAALPDWALAAAWDDAVEHEGPLTGRQLFGGDLRGVAEHLDHLVTLGATVLYLTPFFPARSNHRYDASSFDAVDPLLGGDEALADLLEAAHARGLRVLGDLTTNHTGAGHEWFRAATADPRAPEATSYSFTAHPHEYASWLGVRSLPKLDHADPALRARLYDGPGSVVARWLTGPGGGLDGWRIDVANMTGRHGAQDLAHDVARTLVATARAARSDAWVLAEHGHDAGGDLQGDGWHGAMDYAGFTRPVWTWLSATDGTQVLGRGFFGQPVATPSLPGESVVATMREVHAQVPWRARLASTLHLDSHDVARFRTAVGGGGSGWVSDAGRDRHLAGLALQMTLPGVPSVFAGDEIGLTGVDGEHSRTPFPWHRRGEWDEQTLEAYRAWIGLRRAHVALRRGGLRWAHVGADSLTYLREHPDERVLVHVARAGHEPVRLPAALLGVASAGDVAVLAGEAPAAGEEGQGVVELPASGPGAHAYLLPPPAGRGARNTVAGAR